MCKTLTFYLRMCFEETANYKNYLKEKKKKRKKQKSQAYLNGHFLSPQFESEVEGIWHVTHKGIQSRKAKNVKET